MSRLLDVLAPPRLGRGFRLVVASSWTSNLGDGIALAAGPLLVASKTDQEFLVALAALLQWAPPLLFGLWAGALTDRLDRRLIIVAVDLLPRSSSWPCSRWRSPSTSAPIALVLVAMFLLGTAEVFADNTASTLLPMLVHRDDLAIANARLMTGVDHDQPAGGAADRRVPVHGRPLHPVRDPGARRGARRPPDRPAAAAAAPPRRPRSRSRSGTTSSRASAGPGTTPPSAPWC